ncbi:MAG: cytidylate kinase-like family protein [Candidatus Limnocylindrales bacterium]|jgi:cytidylate kinase
MPVVTISRQFGAGGSSVAGIVAAELHAEVVDKKLIEEVARRLQISPNDVAAEEERPRLLLERLVRSFSTLEPAMGAGWQPPYPDPLFDPRKAIIELTEQIINEVADGGNVVIVGRGAGFCLRGRPTVFRVFLRAPEAVRIRVLMERFGLGEADAKRKMHETDANRAAYIHQLYKKDWCDPDEYDLIVNTGRLGYQATAEVILRGLREPVRVATPLG